MTGTLPNKVVEARDSSKQSWMKRGKTSGFCTLPYNKPQIPRESDLKATRRALYKSKDFLLLDVFR